MAKENKEKKYKISSEMGWRRLKRKEKIQLTKDVIKAFNQSMRELEKQGLAEESNVYRSLQERNKRTKTGLLGYSSEGIEKMHSSEIRALYEKVQRAYAAPSASVAKKQIQESRDRRMAMVGIDAEEMRANSKQFRDFEDDFWDLYNKGMKAGLWKDFGLYSYDVEEFLRDYSSTHILPKKGAGVAHVVKKAKDKYDFENAVSQTKPNKLKDAHMQETLLFAYESEKSNSIYESLLAALAENKYGKTPIENSMPNIDEKDPNKRGYLPS